MELAIEMDGLSTPKLELVDQLETAFFDKLAANDNRTATSANQPPTHPPPIIGKPANNISLAKKIKIRNFNSFEYQLFIYFSSSSQCQMVCCGILII